MKIIQVEQANSSNDLIREYSEHLTFVVVKNQTAGRGQRGNHWESAPGENLTMSILVKPSNLMLSNQFYISKATSNSLVKTLQRVGLSAEVKWPNDIYIGDRKICGILIENDALSSGRIFRSIIGVGLNINQEKFVSDAPNPTSIKIESSLNYTIESVLEIFCEEFEKEFSLLEKGNFDSIDSFYLANLYRLNQEALFSDSEGRFKGVILDVKESGELIVQRGESNKSYLFKEIAFII